MAEWLVELRGHIFDLEHLAALFTTPLLLVVREGDEFRLKSTEFDALGTSEEVHAKAEQLMITLNGIASVYADHYRNVEISGGLVCIDADGAKKRYVLAAACGSFRMKGSAATLTIGGEPVPPKPTQADITLNAAVTQEVLSRALGFFSLEKTWGNLYKVLDAIEQDMGSAKALSDQKWERTSDIKRFTGTANDHNAAKGSARHGFISKRAMANPMSLGEAEQLIRTIMTKWIVTKYSI
jgi:hypothetical protein